MPPRAMWKGQLRISLVSFGVRMYAATESSSRVSMNQLHAECNQRVKNLLTCPVHGTIGRDEIVKGYEYEKGSYVIMDDADLDSIKLESTKNIDLVQFVDETEIDPLYFDSPYFLGPDGPLAEEAFRVIREALFEAGKIGIGKVVMRSREQIVAVKPLGKGFLLMTLRYAEEVRAPGDVFADVSDEAADAEQVQLAQSIIATKASEWDASAYKDDYRDKFLDIVKSKVAGAEPVAVSDDEAPSSINFMDALKKSVEEAKEVAKKPAAKSTRKKTTKKPAAGSVKSEGGKKKRGTKSA